MLGFFRRAERNEEDFQTSGDAPREGNGEDFQTCGETRHGGFSDVRRRAMMLGGDFRQAETRHEDGEDFQTCGETRHGGFSDVRRRATGIFRRAETRQTHRGEEGFSVAPPRP